MPKRATCPHCDAATKEHPGQFHMEAGVSTVYEPFVHLAWGNERQQMTPQEAREMAANLVQISLVAEYEAAWTRWCRDKMDLNDAQAAMMLMEIRDYFAQVEDITGGRQPSVRPPS